MPCLKHKAIHTGVADFLNYIENAYKTNEQKLITGINCPTDISEACKSFKRTYEHFSNMSFDLNRVTHDKAEKGHKANHDKILMHHYIQSFDPNENITPEKANEIGVEWAKKTFGNDFQFIVSTHVDKDHIHNHVAVCPFSLNGMKWNSNLATLNYARRISDKIALEHGLSVIKPKTKNYMRYKEWLDRQNGTSWKAELCQKIDNLIMQDDVNSLEDLQMKLQNENYYVRLGKYVTIKPPGSSRGVRTENLDKLYGGYSKSELEYRIKHKEKEISLSAISLLSGGQKLYALYMRNIQITVFHQNNKTKNPNLTYRELVESSKLLNYLVLNNIHSMEELANKADDAENEYVTLKKREVTLKKDLSKLTSLDNRHIKDNIESELSELNEQINVALIKKRETEHFWQQYISEKQTDAYNQAVREYRLMQNKINELPINDRSGDVRKSIL